MLSSCTVRDRDWPQLGGGRATLAAAALFSGPPRSSRRRPPLQKTGRRYHLPIPPASRPAFASVDLDTLKAELLAVVDQTVEPTRASFWTLPRPYQEAKTRAWPPDPSS